MSLADYYPYRSAESRDLCLRYLEGLAAERWPIASEARLIPTTFGATFARISGPPDAPTLLLLHGAGSTSLMWAPNVAALSRDFRTVAVDQVGEFGGSACTQPPDTLPALMTWLDDLIAALVPPGGRVVLIGMSYGGALAAHYALHAPQRLDKVVLLAPASTVLRPPAAFWLRLLVLAIVRKRGLAWFFRWIFPRLARTDPKSLDPIVEQLSLNLKHVQRHHPPIPPVFSDAQWRAFRPHTLFLSGEREVIYSAPAAVARLRRLAPQIATGILPDCGHDLTFAQAALVNERILRFLQAPAGAAS
ncbi:MAG: alpha/beta hydrolase [Acidobacteria bacterium]|nr:alpha/beta hydrolase [Acidobacteriota bacterium]